MAPGQHVEVEARDAHDGVVGVTLVAHGEVGEGAPVEGEVVVGRVRGFELGRAGRKEGHVLNVGVVVLLVGKR